MVHRRRSRKDHQNINVLAHILFDINGPTWSPLTLTHHLPHKVSMAKEGFLLKGLEIWGHHTIFSYLPP